MEKKIAIFSDVHGNIHALNTILNDIGKKGIKDIYCLGDVIALGPNPRECLDLIIENNIKMVLGNHELYYLKGTNIDDEMSNIEEEHQKWVSNQLNDGHRKFLNNCLLTIDETIGSYSFSFQHFLLNQDKNVPYPFDDLDIVENGSIENKVKLLKADITFIGHEHKPFEINIENKKLIDVGSSGCTKDENTFYTILSIQNSNINIKKINLKYDRKQFEKDFSNKIYPNKKEIEKLFFGINSL